MLGGIHTFYLGNNTTYFNLPQDLEERRRRYGKCIIHYDEDLQNLFVISSNSLDIDIFYCSWLSLPNLSHIYLASHCSTSMFIEKLIFLKILKMCYFFQEGSMRIYLLASEWESVWFSSLPRVQLSSTK